MALSAACFNRKNNNIAGKATALRMSCSRTVTKFLLNEMVLKILRDDDFLGTNVAEKRRY